MKKFQLTENLMLHEYFDRATYLKYERANALHKLAYKLDKQLVEADQMLRDYFGRVTINNWYEGGSRNWSGYRTPASSYYSKDSLHSEAKASDKLFENASADEVRLYIMKNWKFLGITAIEAGVPWIHSDTRFIPFQTKLFIFNK